MVKHIDTSDGVEILHRLFVRGKPEREASLAAERVNITIAQLIYDLRNEAGLSQQQLAQLVGTTQSVISRLEDADYRGHSLTMLRRIAQALGKRLVISAEDDEDALRGAFPIAIRNLRCSTGLTVDQLAEKIGIEKSELEAMEHDASYEPSIDALRQLGRFYGIPLSALARLAGAETDVPLEVRESPAEYVSRAGAGRKPGKKRKPAGTGHAKRKPSRAK